MAWNITFWLYCHNGQEHQWRKTGEIFYYWGSTVSGDQTPPPNAPYYEIERCAVCGATREAA